MKTLITYGSKYGSARQYAEWFSEMTGFPIKKYNRARDICEYEQVIHFGALYAGGVAGLKCAARRICKSEKLIIVTVGLADVSDGINTNNIKKSIQNQISADAFKNCEIYHLRGAIDYKKLNIVHRIMMSLLYAKAKKLPEEKKTAETKMMIETYGQKVSFISKKALLELELAEKLEGGK